MDELALTDAWSRISRERNGVGSLELPSLPATPLIATAYDDLAEQSMYVQPLEAMTGMNADDIQPMVFSRRRREDGTFDRWELRR